MKDSSSLKSQPTTSFGKRWLWRSFTLFYVALLVVTIGIIGKGLIRKFGLLSEQTVEIPAEKSLQKIVKKSRLLLGQFNDKSGIRHITELQKPFVSLLTTRKHLQRLERESRTWLEIIQKVKSPKFLVKLKPWTRFLKQYHQQITQAIGNLKASYKNVESTHDNLKLTLRLMKKMASHIEKIHQSALRNQRWIKSMRSTCMGGPIKRHLKKLRGPLYSKTIALQQIEKALSDSLPKFKVFSPLARAHQKALSDVAKLPNPLAAIQQKKLIQAIWLFQQKESQKALTRLLAKKKPKPTSAPSKLVVAAPSSAIVRILKLLEKTPLPTLKTPASLTLLSKIVQKPYGQELPDLGVLDLQLHSFYKENNVSGIPLEELAFSSKSMAIFKQCDEKQGKRYRDWFEGMVKGSPRDQLYLVADGTLYAVDLLFQRYYRLGKKGHWKRSMATKFNDQLGQIHLVQNNNLYNINPLDGTYRRLNPVINDWHTSRTMTLHKSLLYIICNHKLYKTNPITGSYRRLNLKKRWYSAKGIVPLGDWLYLAQRKVLSRVSPQDGSYKRVKPKKGKWRDVKGLEVYRGKLYLLANQNLYRIEPKTGAYQQVNRKDGEWRKARTITLIKGKLYIIRGEQLFEVDPSTGHSKPILPSIRWKKVEVMTGTL